MNPTEKRLAEMIGTLVIENAKLVAKIEAHAAEIARLKGEIEKSAEPSLPLQNGNGAHPAN
jgi:hypothetical protein